MVKLATAKLSSKNQITIPKRVIEEFGLESGDRLLLEVRNGEIVLKPAFHFKKPTETFYGSIRQKIDAVKAIREFRDTGGRT